MKILRPEFMWGSCVGGIFNQSATFGDVEDLIPRFTYI